MQEFEKLPLLKRLMLKWKDREQYLEYKYLLELSRSPQVNLNLDFKGQVSFKHSGNAGDIIYALPSIYAISKELPAVLLLNPEQPTIYNKGTYHPYGSVMLTRSVIEKLRPLLLYQSPIKECLVYDQQKIDVDLDLFRKFPLFRGQGNIARWYFYIFGINADLSKPWLIAPKVEGFEDTIIIARSHRYRNPQVNYSFLQQYPSLGFIGLKEEFEDMRKSLPGIRHIEVNDFLEMASIINSCQLFIGNQSFPFALAEGLKVKRVLEVCYYCPNVSPEGINAFDFCYQPQFEKVVERALSI